MIVKCEPLFEGDTRTEGFCERTYDDAECWTICPHGPLWAAPEAYCVAHDLVFGVNHERAPDCTPQK